MDYEEKDDFEKEPDEIKDIDEEKDLDEENESEDVSSEESNSGSDLVKDDDESVPEQQDPDLQKAGLNAGFVKLAFKYKKTVLIGIVALIAIILLAVFANAMNSKNNPKFIAAKCKNVAVTFGSGEDKETKNIPMEQYIISELYSRTKDFKDPNNNTYRTLAIAINTQIQANGTCGVTIIPEVDDVFSFEILDKTDENYLKIQKSIKEVKDFVMVNKEDKSYFSTSIDAFCYESKTEESYYLTSTQQSLEIPTSWVEENVTNSYFNSCPCNANDEELEFCWDDEWNYPDDKEPDSLYIDGGNGIGISAYGVYYLSNNNYNSILKTFYPDKNWVIMTNDESTKKKNDGQNGGLAGFDYIAPKCTKITTTTKTSETGGQGTGPSITLDIDEYIEGVVYHEFRGANSLEAYKSLAVASRSYVLAIVNTNCTINNSTATQTFTAEADRTETTSAAMIKQAVQDTRGIVITNGSIMRAEYDAFCYISKNENTYTMSQGEYGAGGQNIPTSWVESRINSYNYKNCPCNQSSNAPQQCFTDSGKYSDGGHGRGMSQYGSLYLAEEEKWTYPQILKYYYGKDTVLKSIFRGSVNTDGSNSSTDNTTELHEPLRDFLNKNNYSISEFNQLILSNVTNAGVSTRSGVVAAALSLFDTLSYNYNIRIPYTYGGGHGGGYTVLDKDSRKRIDSRIGAYYGVDPYWGSPIVPNGYGMDTTYYYYGPDCSAFVTWALQNGGFIQPMSNSFNFISVAGGEKNKHPVNGTFEGKPGDLIWHSGHIMLIVFRDEEKAVYRVAQASDGAQGMTIGNVHFADTNDYVLDMTDYYNNAANVNPNFLEDFKNKQFS